VLFASAIDGINTLTAAKSASRLKAELKPYTNPALLILDELGYLPIDKTGADLLFQHAFRTLFSGSMGGFQSAL
jgi:DNA replication protein DnaC